MVEPMPMATEAEYADMTAAVISPALCRRRVLHRERHFPRIGVHLASLSAPTGITAEGWFIECQAGSRLVFGDAFLVMAGW